MEPSSAKKTVWRKVKRQDPLPEGAVRAGNTVTDGPIYVALNADGDCGKLNLHRGHAHNIWCPGDCTGSGEGHVLVKNEGTICAWRSVSSGQPLPDGAAYAGECMGDNLGRKYVVRAFADGETGTLLLDEDQQRVKEIRCHHRGTKDYGEVLVIDPSLFVKGAEEQDEQQDKVPEDWKGRWMWYDSETIPMMLVPGPLRTALRRLPMVNPLRWSSWQDFSSILVDLECYQDTRRPVRIETSQGISDVYENPADVVLTLKRHTACAA